MSFTRKNKAVFLDRDGTINKDLGYVHKVKDLVFMNGAIEGLELLSASDYKLIIISNQSGVGRGMYSLEELDIFNNALIERLRENGCRIDGIYCCTHKPEDNCSCRKPATGLLERAAGEHCIDPAKSYMIGDRQSDMNAGKAFGCMTIGIGKLDADYTASDLARSAHIILKGGLK